VSAVGLESISKSYGSTRALANVSCLFHPGVTVALGRNGAGKSTLCKVIAGVEAPDSGAVFATSDQCDPLSVHQLREIAGYMPQHLAFPKGVKVSDYVAYAAWLKGVETQVIDLAVHDALEAVRLLDKQHARLRTLSGGMLRRVGLAVATISSPTLLVLDEPTVGLDPSQRSHFYETIAALSEKVCIVVSTHLMEDAYELASRVVVLSSGAVTFEGTVDEMAARGRGDQTIGRLNDAFKAFTR
jgi:ABC-type multidrug transport system ATPase subunit